MEALDGMPQDGVNTARLHGSASLHLRTLQALHESLFAPQFRALETYGADPPPRPSLSDVRTAAKHAMSWHGEKELELAAELGRLRASGAPSPLVDEAARVLSHHRTERERIARDLAALSD